MTRKRYIYFDENDFDDLETMTKEELISEFKDTHVNHLNYWMEQTENLQNIMDKLIDYLSKTDKPDKFTILEILRGESND